VWLIFEKALAQRRLSADGLFKIADQIGLVGDFMGRAWLLKVVRRLSE
jgi:hypothetical protein